MYTPQTSNLKNIINNSNNQSENKVLLNIVFKFVHTKHTMNKPRI